MVSEYDVRRIALELPETSEKPSPLGSPSFRVKDKVFARIREDGDVLIAWCKDSNERRALVEAGPEKYFTTPHYDRQPHVLVRYKRLSQEELTDILRRSWRHRAPKKLLESVDMKPGTTS